MSNSFLLPPLSRASSRRGGKKGKKKKKKKQKDSLSPPKPDPHKKMSDAYLDIGRFQSPSPPPKDKKGRGPKKES